MGASLQAFHPLLHKLDTTKRFGDSLFVSYEPDCYCPTVNHSLDQPFLFSDKRRSSIYILTFIQNLVGLTAHHVKNIRISSKLSSESRFPLQVGEPTCSNIMLPPVLYQHKYAFQIFAYVRQGADRTVFRY